MAHVTVRIRHITTAGQATPPVRTAVGSAQRHSMPFAPYSLVIARSPSAEHPTRRSTVLGQSHSSLNGGSLLQGGIDGLMAPAPPLDADTPLDAALLLDVDTLRDP